MVPLQNGKLFMLGPPRVCWFSAPSCGDWFPEFWLETMYRRWHLCRNKRGLWNRCQIVIHDIHTVKILGTSVHCVSCLSTKCWWFKVRSILLPLPPFPHPCWEYITNTILVRCVLTALDYRHIYSISSQIPLGYFCLWIKFQRPVLHTPPFLVFLASPSRRFLPIGRRFSVPSARGPTWEDERGSAAQRAAVTTSCSLNLT